MTFYLTFTCIHPLANGWIEIEAESKEEARKKAFSAFGKYWAFLYESDFNKELFLDGKYGETIR